ncbi:calcium/sodium antiporter [Oricola cellulosilytica]|uniref:Calcium/sodium antiporter n=1 Tax=Oricola cellulosilytica TaxID=1429082 RepID=A0A4R0PD03_9HYPH|nr:calcium/sodium antiporter [Oricola cellulosilytica]TCD14298.1 calcium/sodium antiporter [Oricola cellulosilytica]
MLSDIILVATGLVALFAGGEWLVRGAVALASRMGMPTLLISLTVVGFGTSMPELLVSLRAAMEGRADIALGNVVGSNIANILLIIAVSAMVSPMVRWDGAVKRDAIVMVAAGLATLALVQSDVIGATAGVALLAVLAAYVGYAYWADRKAGQALQFHPFPEISRRKTVFCILAGFIFLFAGAEALVNGAVGIARTFGISEAVIGLTIVAVGTSLPELATSVIAAVRRHSDIAIGNIVGSNIFNIFGILGITAVVAPVSASNNFREFDAPVMLVVSVMFAMLLSFGRSIGRIVGLLFLGAYGAYLVMLFAS